MSGSPRHRRAPGEAPWTGLWPWRLSGLAAAPCVGVWLLVGDGVTLSCSGRLTGCLAACVGTGHRPLFLPPLATATCALSRERVPGLLPKALSQTPYEQTSCRNTPAGVSAQRQASSCVIWEIKSRSCGTNS